MGVQISAAAPPETSSYNQWRLYRASSKTGSYSIILTQVTTDLTYFDETGSSTNWYKIDYYNSTSGLASSQSQPIMGQATTYTTVSKVQGYLQLYTLTDSTNPSVQQVIELINRAEDEIDQRTGHAWRMRYSNTTGGQDQTPQYEYHDLEYRKEYQTGKPIYLKHRKIYALDSTQGDALEFWNGSTYEDWITTRTEGRANDYWVDYDRGILYIQSYYLPTKSQAFRIKYRYGETSVNKVIEDIATKIVGIDILTGMDTRANIVSEGAQIGMTHQQRVDYWRSDVERKLQTLKEIKIPSIKL